MMMMIKNKTEWKSSSWVASMNSNESYAKMQKELFSVFETHAIGANRRRRDSLSNSLL